MEKLQPLSELDSKLNELAFRLGMSRQHKKLIKELLVELTQKCYHDGYHEGYDDGWEANKPHPFSPDYNDGHDSWTEIKENSE